MLKLDPKQAYKRSYYTILGAGGDPQEWIDNYEDLMKKEGMSGAVDWYSCKGKDINNFASNRGEITYDNRFQPDLDILAFSYTPEDLGKLMIFKIMMGDRWFDDVVDNMVANSRKGY